MGIREVVVDEPQQDGVAALRRQLGIRGAALDHRNGRGSASSDNSLDVSQERRVDLGGIDPARFANASRQINAPGALSSANVCNDSPLFDLQDFSDPVAFVRCHARHQHETAKR
jgi:hypothetical protein